MIWIHCIPYKRSQRITFLAKKKKKKKRGEWWSPSFFIFFSAIKSNTNLKNKSEKKVWERRQAKSKFGLEKRWMCLLLQMPPAQQNFRMAKNSVLLLFPPFIFFLFFVQLSIPFSSSLSSQPLLAPRTFSFQFSMAAPFF